MPAHRKSGLLHHVQGTAKTIHDRAADVSGVPAGRPPIPKDITALGLRKQFKDMVRLLEERQTATKGDRELVRLYVILQDRHVRNMALLREEGELVTYYRLDSHGQSVPQVKTNLRLKICVEAERQMTTILSSLGLTPTAKDRAKPTRDAEPKEEELTFEEQYIRNLENPRVLSIAKPV
jgi:P27 family predicted phage terminase small subunit